MDTKYLKKVGLYILCAIASLGLISYVVYHMLDGFTTDISTVTAEVSTKKSTISSDGYIFKDEHYLYSTYSGAINYVVDDGEKVGIRQAVAETFSDSVGYSLRSDLAKIERKIRIIEESTSHVNTATSDTSAVDKKIVSNYHQILKKLSEGKFSHVINSTDNLLIQMNRRQLITGENTGLESLRRSLEAEKAELTAKLSGRSETVSSDESGYFFKEIDGYESIFSKAALDSLTLESFYSLTSISPTSPSGDQSPVGKICTDYKWYIALPVSAAESSLVSIGKTYKAVFPYNYDTELTLRAEKILTEHAEDRAVIVFSASEMPTGFNYQRVQSVEIVMNESSGYRIPMSAVRIIDGIEGVYTLHGSTVVFKRIDILFETDGYYMVSQTDPLSAYAAETGDEGEEVPLSPYKYIALYDQIIVAGKDLTDGMVFY